MIRGATTFFRAAKITAQTAGVGLISPRPPLISPTSTSPLYLWSFCKNTSTSFNPVALQMINYALSHARSQKSDVSYAQGLLVREQCLSTQSNENSKGIVLLATSTLFSERGNYSGAIDRLHEIQDLSLSSLGVRVAATEALVGLHLELGQDGASSVLADVCAQPLDTITLEIGGGCGFEVLEARSKAIKRLIELVRCNLESAAAKAFFQVAQDGKRCAGSFLLAEFFLLAKELYEKLIQGISENKDFSDPYYLAACNMASEEILLAATGALGQKRR